MVFNHLFLNMNTCFSKCSLPSESHWIHQQGYLISPLRPLIFVLYYSLWSLLSQYRSSAWEVIATAVSCSEGSLAECFKIYTSFQNTGASFFQWSVAAQFIYVKFSYKTRHETAAMPCYWAKSEINHECVSGGTKNQKTQRIYTAWVDSPGWSLGCSHNKFLRFL